jgi:cation transporter-like permease
VIILLLIVIPLIAIALAVGLIRGALRPDPVFTPATTTVSTLDQFGDETAAVTFNWSRAR